jgi:hypothetical protein
MTHLLWILVRSWCPNHVEDGSGRGQNVADADHDQRENARMLQSDILIFSWTRITESNFADLKSQQNVAFGRMQTPQKKKTFSVLIHSIKKSFSTDGLCHANLSLRNFKLHLFCLTFSESE